MMLKASRYTDPFLNALMYSHQMTARAELWFEGAKVADLRLVGGNVNADRSSLVNRNAELNVDPNQGRWTIPALQPYGAILKVWRGIRFPDNSVTEVMVFWGRLESVEYTEDNQTLIANDLAAYVVDARMEKPTKIAKGTHKVAAITTLIQGALAGVVVNDLSGSTAALGADFQVDRERAQSISSLASDLGCEWFAGVNGQFYIKPYPSLTSGAPATWVVDTGDTGVIVTRHNKSERQNIYNAVVVNGEPPDNSVPAYGFASDNNPASLTFYGGPFGKVPKFYSSGFITTNAQANATAKSMLAQELAGSRTLDVQCIPNPKLRLGDLVWVQSGRSLWDGMYFVQSFTLPLTTDPMTLVLHTALDTSGAGYLEQAPFAVEEGITWP